MPDYVEEVLKKIEKFAQKKRKKIELLLVGGLSLYFYGYRRVTKDIDGEIKCDEKIYIHLLEYLKKEKIIFDLGEDVSRWGIIPLPQDYRKRAKQIYQSKYLLVKILEPLDFVFSKLLRGTEEDFRDIRWVIKKYKISPSQLRERKRMIIFPKDSESLFFEKKFQYLLKSIK